jgi:hypothetical protein
MPALNAMLNQLPLQDLRITPNPGKRDLRWAAGRLCGQGIGHFGLHIMVKRIMIQASGLA